MIYKIEDNSVVCLDNQSVVGKLHFTINDNKYTITNTFVNPEYRGNGIAKELVRHVIDYVRMNNGTLDATCSYAKNYLEKGKNIV